MLPAGSGARRRRCGGGRHPFMPGGGPMTSHADLGAAMRVLEDCALSPSESLAVIRVAGRIPGGLRDTLVPACDRIADDYEDRALVHRVVARRLQTGDTRPPSDRWETR